MYKNIICHCERNVVKRTRVRLLELQSQSTDVAIASFCNSYETLPR
ncbi:hypothetical protein [Nostoc sp. CHAB 5715]|nr:hypothetical protein [Nostoc sp. CHAB 5715]MCC5623860.1 hypothetical protein [Nostoc sp. CHAB 5715]